MSAGVLALGGGPDGCVPRDAFASTAFAPTDWVVRPFGSKALEAGVPCFRAVGFGALFSRVDERKVPEEVSVIDRSQRARQATVSKAELSYPGGSHPLMQAR
jgi:hypothetical protein